MTLLTISIVLALFSTVAVLAMGVASMARGGEYDEKHDTQFMAARVGLQSATFLLLLVALYLANH